eukprot:CAMPEP_0114141404 /NCGR_PEP_ID=MMETSP0043_2-20121206/17889_1 /TAXON_ID=464988 /ORGANISM="Hemiselmis andersenii, Strain CCMP644" /LENGTH=174 /DNA_ID=CAMNT_0001235541 /DNA_START=17 /DNA_END=538 /DNA_ORIENTATION=+
MAEVQRTPSATPMTPGAGQAWRKPRPNIPQPTPSICTPRGDYAKIPPAPSKPGLYKPTQRPFSKIPPPLRRVLGTKRLRIVGMTVLPGELPRPSSSSTITACYTPQHSNTAKEQDGIATLTDRTVRNLCKELETQQSSGPRPTYTTVTPSPMSVHTPMAPVKNIGETPRMPDLS